MKNKKQLRNGSVQFLQDNCLKQHGKFSEELGSTTRFPRTYTIFRQNVICIEYIPMCLGLTVNFHLGMKSGQAHMFSSLYLVLPVAFTRVLFTRVQGARFLNNFFLCSCLFLFF